MATTNLNAEKFRVDSGNDGIAVVHAVSQLPGGRSLDVEDVEAGTRAILAGHVLIQEDATGDVKPLGVSSGAYEAVPDGWSYLGVLKASVPVEHPMAAIVLAGVVNAAACPFPVTDEVRAGLPLIKFIN